MSGTTKAMKILQIKSKELLFVHEIWLNLHYVYSQIGWENFIINKISSEHLYFHFSFKWLILYCVILKIHQYLYIRPFKKWSENQHSSATNRLIKIFMYSCTPQRFLFKFCKVDLCTEMNECILIQIPFKFNQANL
jgi:hypothetical protein